MEIKQQNNNFFRLKLIFPSHVVLRFAAYFFVDVFKRRRKIKSLHDEKFCMFKEIKSSSLLLTLFFGLGIICFGFVVGIEEILRVTGICCIQNEEILETFQLKAKKIEKIK